MKDVKAKTLRQCYPSGRLKAEWTEKDGKLDGLRRFWFESGQLFAEAEYRDGVIDGYLREWTEEGRMTLLAKAKGGEFHGDYQSWWDDGVIKEEGVYVAGKRQPGYRWYRSNGEFWRKSE